jgi:hypothetical protein
MATQTSAGQPADARVVDGQPIDTLIETVVSKRKAAADATKAAALAEVELKNAVEALNKRLTELGLNGPVVPPGPGPVIPPGPVVPTDPLAAKLWAAYRADAGVTKAEDLATLVELMKQAGALTDDPAVTTVGQLAGRVALAAGILAKERLAGVRAVLKVELAAAFPTDGVLDPTTRAAAKAVFVKLQGALTEAGK